VADDPVPEPSTKERLAELTDDERLVLAKVADIVQKIVDGRPGFRRQVCVTRWPRSSTALDASRGRATIRWMPCRQACPRPGQDPPVHRRRTVAAVDHVTLIVSR
jgi:hypothetical protein